MSRQGMNGTGYTGHATGALGGAGSAFAWCGCPLMAAAAGWHGQAGTQPPSPSALPLASPQGFHLLRAQPWDTTYPDSLGKQGPMKDT